MEKIRVGKELGRGTEKDVFEDPDNPDRVIGLYRRENDSERKTKARYYLTKILNLLYPEYIRDIHAAYSDPKMTISSRVESTLLRKVKSFFKIEPANNIHLIIARLSECGVWCDHASCNFMYDKNDNLIYIDSFDPWSRIDLRANFSVDRLKEAIQHLDETDRKRAEIFLERLIQLAKEEGIKVN